MFKDLAILIVFLLIMFISMVTFADVRISRIANAWNSGDQAATQADFDRNKPREMAEMGAIVKGKLTIEKIKLVDMTLYGLPDSSLVLVDIDGTKHVWMIDNCPDNKKFCGFFHKELNAIPYIGQMEYGQAVDVASTAIGLSTGFAEANPLGGSPAGLAWLLGYKAFWIAYSRSGEMDMTTCIGTRHGFSVFGYGSGVKNVAVMLGASNPVSLGVGALAMWAMWDGLMEDSIWECARFTLEA
jgi:hypothetical protein